MCIWDLSFSQFTDNVQCMCGSQHPHALTGYFPPGCGWLFLITRLSVWVIWGAKQRWKYRMVARSFTGMMTPEEQQVWDRERHTIWACWVSSVSTTHMWDFNLRDIDEYPILVGLPAGGFARRMCGAFMEERLDILDHSHLNFLSPFSEAREGPTAPRSGWWNSPTSKK